MKLAIDPYMFRETTSLLELPGAVADLGYEWIELSPREDSIPFFKHPRVDDAEVAAFKKALAAAGVGVSSVLRYIVNPPGSQVTVHQHLDIGQGEVDFEQFFRGLERIGFDGIVTSCVFAWEDRTRESSTYMRDTIKSYLDKWSTPPTFVSP